MAAVGFLVLAQPVAKTLGGAPQADLLVFLIADPAFLRQEEDGDGTGDEARDVGVHGR